MDPTIEKQKICNTVKVYKTDVKNRSEAKKILSEIRRIVPGCDPSFDLEDCDSVLRIESGSHPVDDQKIKTALP